MTKDEFKTAFSECLQDKEIEIHLVGGDNFLVKIWWDKDRVISDEFIL